MNFPKGRKISTNTNFAENKETEKMKKQNLNVSNKMQINANRTVINRTLGKLGNQLNAPAGSTKSWSETDEEENTDYIRDKLQKIQNFENDSHDSSENSSKSAEKKEKSKKMKNFNEDVNSSNLLDEIERYLQKQNEIELSKKCTGPNVAGERRKNWTEEKTNNLAKDWGKNTINQKTLPVQTAVKTQKNFDANEKSKYETGMKNGITKTIPLEKKILPEEKRKMLTNTDGKLCKESERKPGEYDWRKTEYVKEEFFENVTDEKLVNETNVKSVSTAEEDADCGENEKIIFSKEIFHNVEQPLMKVSDKDDDDLETISTVQDCIKSDMSQNVQQQRRNEKELDSSEISETVEKKSESIEEDKRRDDKYMENKKSKNEKIVEDNDKVSLELLSENSEKEKKVDNDLAIKLLTKMEEAEWKGRDTNETLKNIQHLGTEIDSDFSSKMLGNAKKSIADNISDNVFMVDSKTGKKKINYPIIKDFLTKTYQEAMKPKVVQYDPVIRADIDNLKCELDRIWKEDLEPLNKKMGLNFEKEPPVGKNEPTEDDDEIEAVLEKLHEVFKNASKKDKYKYLKRIMKRQSKLQDNATVFDFVKLVRKSPVLKGKTKNKIDGIMDGIFDKLQVRKENLEFLEKMKELIDERTRCQNPKTETKLLEIN